MRKRIRHLLLLIIAFMMLPQAWSALAVANTNNLAFGSFAAGTGGTITISPNGARSRSGGVVLLSSDTGRAATFSISDTDPANALKTYIISLPVDGAVTIVNGNSSMAVNNFTSDPSGSGVMTSGNQILAVGATLSVAAGQPTGSYSGSFNVTVNYQ